MALEEKPGDHQSHYTLYVEQHGYLHQISQQSIQQLSKHFTKSQKHLWRHRKQQGLTNIIGFHHLGTMNTSTNCHGSPSDQKLVDRPTNKQHLVQHIKICSIKVNARLHPSLFSDSRVVQQHKVLCFCAIFDFTLLVLT